MKPEETKPAMTEQGEGMEPNYLRWRKAKNLLPCPFCGNIPEWVGEVHPASKGLKCFTCQYVITDDRKDKIIYVWNNRVTSQSPARKELESISEEDAVEVAETVWGWDEGCDLSNLREMKIEKGRGFVKSMFDESHQNHPTLTLIQIYQFLESRGYKLPRFYPTVEHGKDAIKEWDDSLIAIVSQIQAGRSLDAMRTAKARLAAHEKGRKGE